ncbi:MAG TPA: RluA family pseudouridine synthase [Vicinamibacteria bacterium]|nr:RluA family pseudouridine synthase [Vicinamibacteria bacterium]
MRRLDVVLIAKHPGLSRRKARAAIEKGHVTLDGAVVCEPGRRVSDDAALVFDPNRPSLPRARLSLPRLHEDDHVLVVDKPPGLLAVPTPGGDEDSVLGRVREYARHRGVAFVRAVHRLDRDTSGALALALSREAADGLIAAFRDHRIERRYLCLALGAPGADAGTIDAPIRERYTSGRRGVARPGEAARPALSRWRVVERLRSAVLLEVELQTGRQHQIRAHLAHVGLPVLGDAVYGRSQAPVPVRRILLHAALLVFVHPVTGRRLRVESPLPPDFAQALSALRRGHR